MISLIQWIKDKNKPADSADDALDQLREANKLATSFREAKSIQTGNPVADMARGTYVPQRRRK